MSQPGRQGRWPLFGTDPETGTGRDAAAAPAGSDLDAARRMGEYAFLIRAERRRRDMSVEALANKAGVHRSTLSRLENGTYYPRIDVVLRAMSVLDLSSTPPAFERYRDASNEQAHRSLPGPGPGPGPGRSAGAAERLGSGGVDEAGVEARMEQFALVIRGERQRRGLSVAALAAEARVHRSTLARLEKSTHYPRMDVVLRVMSILGLSSTPPPFVDYLRQPGLRGLGVTE